MEVYSEKINDLIDDLRHAGKIADATVSAVNASLECGTAITFELNIRSESKLIAEIKFRTNGCGYMTAAGEIISRALIGRELTSIGGFEQKEILESLNEHIGDVQFERKQCLVTAAEAVRKALAMYRKKVADEYNGDSPLVCSCYGISEDAVNKVITKYQVNELSQFLSVSKAGTGCGSCRMVIEDLIEISVQ